MSGLGSAGRAIAVVGLVALVAVVAACTSTAGLPSTSASARPSGVGPVRGISGKATAGPVCPVERVPPDPSCEARPVAGAVILIRDETGVEVGRTTTEADGTYFIAVPVGTYTVVPQPATGLMGTPAPRTVKVEFVTDVDFSYDTGIR